MSSTLKSKKKPELQALAAELGIDTDGSKADLEARILLHLSEHTELKDNSKFKKYFASIAGPESPGPVARRRNIAAKKAGEIGDKIVSAITRFVICLHSRTDVSIVMRRTSPAQRLLKRSNDRLPWPQRQSRIQHAISWLPCHPPFRRLRA
jgi:hypothetical protein